MECIRVVEINGKEQILAFCNPEDMKDLGLTLSTFGEGVARCQQQGSMSEFAQDIAEEYIFPYFKENVQADYADYAPLFINFCRMMDDMVLPVISLTRRHMDQIKLLASISSQNIWRIMQEETARYIQDYMEEKAGGGTEHGELTSMPAIKDKPYPSQGKLPKKDENVVTVRVNDLRTALYVCRFIPPQYCDAGNIVKTNGRYYVSFYYPAEKWKAIRMNVCSMTEFGDYLKPNIAADNLCRGGEVVVRDIRQILHTMLIT